MLRSNAPGLYGWSILLRGTLWPGPVIGQRLAHIIRQTAEDGHQMGFHAWDHQAWQANIESWDSKMIQTQYRDGVTMMTEILGRAPSCSAAPSWRSCEMALTIEEQLPFEYNSDCRGSSIFVPVLSDTSLTDTAGALRQPQVPVTLPTYDEMVGTDGMTGPGYYEKLLSLLDPNKLNVLTIHAEVEGMSRLQDFARFVTQAQERGWSFVPLSDLIGEESTLPHHKIVKDSVSGREGWVSCQAKEGS